MENSYFKLFIFCSSLALLACCEPNPPEVSAKPTPYVLELPATFPDLIIPPDNPLTEEGVTLGRRLFFDPILSADRTQSCSSCHDPNNGFSDSRQFSIGIDGIAGTRNAMAIINLGWHNKLFWDGREKSLEDQARRPVPDPIEMHLEWPEAVKRLEQDRYYRALFKEAFESDTISEDLVVKAIAQFERTLISANSKFDRREEEPLTESEQRGFDIFFSERGDCFHCHGTVLFTDNLFHNNGLDVSSDDVGLGAITANALDFGKFKTPTLRNIEHTAPYMHDGRFKTLEEVVDFYSEGVQFSRTIDPLMKQVERGGIQLLPSQKEDLIAFLKTLTDEEFLNNPRFRSPF